MSEPKVLLEVDGLRTHFHSEEGVAKAVDGVSFRVHEGQTLGVVGESGSGKSVTALSIMRLIPMPPGRFEGGRILFRGDDLLGLTEERLRELRGNEIAMIFQEPMTALNPVYTVGNQIMGRSCCTRARTPTRPARTRSRCCARSGSRARRAGSTATRTSCRAACASG